MNQKRNIGLDLARVLAIGLVWIGHSSCFSLGLNPAFMEYGGIFCIELFFALSGFLVGRSMIRTVMAERVGPAMKKFYLNRLVRTLPLYYLTLLPMWAMRKSAPPVAYLFFLQNFSTKALDYFPPSWTMPIEMWFYFLIPVVFLAGYRLLSRKMEQEKAVFLTIGLLCFVPFLLRIVWVVQTDPAWDFGVRKQVFLRMDALMMGVFWAALKLYRPKRYSDGGSVRNLLLSVLGILLLYWWYMVQLRDHFDDSNLGRILMFTLMPMCCSLLVAWLDNAAWPEKLRGTIWEKLICGISSMGYSIYLVHWIIFQLVAPYFAEARFLVSWLGFLLALVLTMIASWLAYRLIEVPLGKWKEKLVQGKATVQ